MSVLGLSPAALEVRRSHIMAGDAAKILTGEWREVWQKKMGERAEDDLSGELRVQMGLYTEPFNLFWCERATGREIAYYSDSSLLGDVWHYLTDRHPVTPELQVSAEYPFMACHLDGTTTTPQGLPCVIDAKHVGRADEQAILNYTAAGTHQATVMGLDWWALSFFVGNGKHEVVYQEVDPLFQASLIAKEREFWGYVERGEEPPEMAAPVLAPKPQPRLRKISLDGGEFVDGQWMPPPDGGWPNWAGEFIPLIYDFAGTEAAAKKHAITREAMKALVPEDVGEITRGRFRLARTKAGAVTMALKKEEGSDGDL